MSFHLIDMDHWPRKEFYLHYMNEVVCSYSINVELDITALCGEKLYPAMIWLLTSTVNQFQEFRTCLTDDGPGYFDVMNPSYTVFNDTGKNFSCIWTEFTEDYTTFYKQYQEDVERYSCSTQFAPKPGMPKNCFDISMLPWLTFTGFNINVFGSDSGKHLLPIFTMGKWIERDNKRILPLAIQVHHAVCDGYHVAMFFKELQSRITKWSR